MCNNLPPVHKQEWFWNGLVSDWQEKIKQKHGCSKTLLLEFGYTYFERFWITNENSIKAVFFEETKLCDIHPQDFLSWVSL